jgi:hypothetical protein
MHLLAVDMKFTLLRVICKEKTRKREKLLHESKTLSRQKQAREIRESGIPYLFISAFYFGGLIDGMGKKFAHPTIFKNKIMSGFS